MTNKQTRLSTHQPSTQSNNREDQIIYGSANPIFRSAYSAKGRCSLSFPTEGRTKQSFKDECDINIIMSRYMKTGQLEHLSQRAPSYGDIQDIDFQEAMDIVAYGREAFAALPSELRDRFANDPARFLAFVQDPSNQPEAKKLGLLKASEGPPPHDLNAQAAPLPTPPAASPGGVPAAKAAS